MALELPADAAPLGAGGALKLPTDAAPLGDVVAPLTLPADATPLTTPAAELGAVESRYKFDPERRDVTAEELAQVAAAHKVDPRWLQEHANYFGAAFTPQLDAPLGEHAAEAGKKAVGLAASVLPVSIPDLVKKLGIDDPAKRLALDDLQEIVRAKKGWLEKGGELAAGLLVPFGVAKQIGAAARLGNASKAAVGVAEAAAIGGAGGYAGSKEGHETSSAIVGAGLGALIGAAAAGIGSYLGSRAERIAAEEAGAVAGGARATTKSDAAARRLAEDVEAEAAQRIQQRAPDEKVLEDLVLRPEIRQAARAGDLEKLESLTNLEQRSTLARLAHDDSPAARVGVVEEAVKRLDKALHGRIEDAIQTEGADHVRAVFQHTRTGAEMEAVMARHAERAGGLAPGMLGRGLQFMKDARYVYDDIDRRHSTRLVPLVDQLSEQYNKFTAELGAATLGQRPAHAATLAAERESEKGSGAWSLFDALKRPRTELDDLTPKQRDAVDAWHAFFDAARKRANKLGVPITELEGGGYVPEMAVDGAKFVSQMDDAAAKLKLSIHDDESLARVIEVAAKRPKSLEAEYVRGLTLAAPETKVTDPASMRVAIGLMENPTQLESALQSRSKFSQQRSAPETADGVARIPEWLLEKDVTKLGQRWIHNTLRHAYLRAPLSELAAKARALRSVSPSDADYLERHITDILGVREGTAAAFMGSKVAGWAQQMQRAAAAETNPVKKAAIEAAAGIPQMLQWAGNQMYPYYLGLKPAAAFKNSLQTMLMSVPAVGADKVGYFVAPATIRALLTAVRHPNRTAKMLAERGLAPADMPAEAVSWMRDGLERSPLRAFGQKAVDRANQWAMALYKASDTITRTWTAAASEQLANAALKDPKLAADLASRMEIGYARQWTEALRAGDQSTAIRSLGSWLNGKTLYHYNRAAMSEYGRTMGSLFSAFTKWPLATSSDAIINPLQRVQRGESKFSAELLRSTNLYLGPLFLMKGLEYAVQGSEGPTPLQKGWLGSSLEGASPATAIGDVLKLNPLTAPLPQTALNIGAAAVTGDLPALWYQTLEGASSVLPGGAWLRFFTKEFWQALRGEEPPTTGPALAAPFGGLEKPASLRKGDH